MKRLAAVAALVVAAGAALLALAWNDVLPGAWRLRRTLWSEERVDAWLLARARAERVALFDAENPGVPAGHVVFVGSSTIQRWPTAELFPGAVCANRGMPGEPARDLLARLAATLPPTEPAGAVVYAASADFRFEHATPAQCAERARAVIRALRERTPGLPVALVGLLSGRDADAGFVSRLAATNAALRAMAEEEGAAFVPTDRPPLVDAGGALPFEVTVDRWHLTRGGYEALSRWLVEDGGAVGSLLAPR